MPRCTNSHHATQQIGCQIGAQCPTYLPVHAAHCFPQALEMWEDELDFTFPPNRNKVCGSERGWGTSFPLSHSSCHKHRWHPVQPQIILHPNFRRRMDGKLNGHPVFWLAHTAVWSSWHYWSSRQILVLPLFPWSPTGLQRELGQRPLFGVAASHRAWQNVGGLHSVPSFLTLHAGSHITEAYFLDRQKTLWFLVSEHLIAIPELHLICSLSLWSSCILSGWKLIITTMWQNRGLVQGFHFPWVGTCLGRCLGKRLIGSWWPKEGLRSAVLLK